MNRDPLCVSPSPRQGSTHVHTARARPTSCRGLRTDISGHSALSVTPRSLQVVLLPLLPGLTPAVTDALRLPAGRQLKMPEQQGRDAAYRLSPGQARACDMPDSLGDGWQQGSAMLPGQLKPSVLGTASYINLNTLGPAAPAHPHRPLWASGPLCPAGGT